MTPEIIIQFLPLGIGGLIAGLVINWKREDDKKHKEELVDLLANYDKHISRLDTRDERMLLILQANTDALRALQAAITLLVDVDKLEQRLGKRGQ